MTDARQGTATRAAVKLIALYQAARAGRPTACRFHPSCSAYAVEALESHGFWRGAALSARRFARCNPLGSHGIDEVPPVSSGARP